jgi:hypothetical protein
MKFAMCFISAQSYIIKTFHSHIFIRLQGYRVGGGDGDIAQYSKRVQPLEFSNPHAV